MNQTGTAQNNERKVRIFALTQSFVDEFIGKQPRWGFGGLGYFTYKRTYAEKLPTGGTEEFWQTCRRVVEAVYNIQKAHCRQLRLPWDEAKAQKSAQEMYVRMWQFKWLPPGRGLQNMNLEKLAKKGGAILLNCGFCSTENIDVDFTGPFTFLMDFSMLGVGIGGDVKGAGKVKIVQPRVSDATYVVEDSREGWVDLLRVVLNAYIGKGLMPAKIDYSLLRPAGAPLKGLGGVSSGPEPLIALIKNLEKLLTPKDGAPYKITASQIADIYNFVGKCVVSGGIRRTAEILLGEPGDEEFANLKLDKEALADRRWASNNSILANVGMDYSPFIGPIATNGEPGFVWMDNARSFKRMDGIKGRFDKRIVGVNPCVEVGLEDRECCNLVEIYPSNHEVGDLKDFLRTCKFAYLYAKTVTLIPTHDERTNAVMMRNRRIGGSHSGITQAIEKFGRREYLNMCDVGYDYLRNMDEIYSEWLCIPKSIKITSVKPSGTVSLLTGNTPGIHYPHSEYYLRNVRVADTSPLVKKCVDACYKVEPDGDAPNTFVVSFPVKEENFSKGKDDVTIWEQFANAADLQRHWADNQVSCTVSFKTDEVKDIKTCLEVYESKLKGISLMPLKEHMYEQAPYIKISKEEYDAYVASLRTLDLTDADHEADDKFCDGTACEIRNTRS